MGSAFPTVLPRPNSVSVGEKDQRPAKPPTKFLSLQAVHTNIQPFALSNVSHARSALLPVNTHQKDLLFRLRYCPQAQIPRPSLRLTDALRLWHFNSWGCHTNDYPTSRYHCVDKHKIFSQEIVLPYKIMNGCCPIAAQSVLSLGSDLTMVTTEIDKTRDPFPSKTGFPCPMTGDLWQNSSTIKCCTRTACLAILFYCQLCSAPSRTKRAI